MSFRNITWMMFSMFLMGACTSREEEQADFWKTAHNIRENLEFVEAVREASAQTGVYEEILYGLAVVEGARHDTYLNLTRFDRVGRLGLFHYQEDDRQDNSKFTLKNIFLAAAKDLRRSYEVTGNWDLALLAWGSDDLVHVSLCLSDFPGGDLEEFISNHLVRWRTAPCFDGSPYQNFEGSNARRWARQYSYNNLRNFGTYVKSRIDMSYPRGDSPPKTMGKLPPPLITLECPNSTVSTVTEGVLRAGCNNLGDPFAIDALGETLRFSESPAD